MNTYEQDIYKRFNEAYDRLDSDDFGAEDVKEMMVTSGQLVLHGYTDSVDELLCSGVGDIDEVYAERVDECIWDLQNSMYELLAVSVIQAQALLAFFIGCLQHGYVSCSNSYEQYRKLYETLETVQLDEEAHEMLQAAERHRPANTFALPRGMHPCNAQEQRELAQLILRDVEQS